MSNQPEQLLSQVCGIDPVTKITAARLYSTGNYEHHRYEVTIEVTDKPGDALRKLDQILADLNPACPVDENHVAHAKSILAGDTDGLSPQYIENLQSGIAAHHEWQEKRNAAYEKLNELAANPRGLNEPAEASHE